MRQDPSKERSKEELLEEYCRFPKYKESLYTWRDVLDKDPEYIVWLFDNNKLGDEFEEIYEEAYKVL